jgi:hypothetical protein
MSLPSCSVLICLNWLTVSSSIALLSGLEIVKLFNSGFIFQCFSAISSSRIFSCSRRRRSFSFFLKTDKRHFNFLQVLKVITPIHCKNKKLKHVRLSVSFIANNETNATTLCFIT